MSELSEKETNLLGKCLQLTELAFPGKPVMVLVADTADSSGNDIHMVCNRGQATITAILQDVLEQTPAQIRMVKIDKLNVRKINPDA